MTQRFQDQVIIVTGGSEGIGLAAAMSFATEGGKVVICSRSEEKLQAASKQIEEAGGECSYHAVNLEDTDAFAELINCTAKKYGRLDVLVNNAAVTRHKMISAMTLKEWRLNFAVTADATFVGTQAAMAIMAKQEQGGAIVNVSSSCGAKAAMGVSGYSASKAAMESFSRCAAMEGATAGIRVNTVVPGMVATAASVAAISGNDAMQKTLESGIPMQRSATPEEVAAAICFLASEEASFITGVELPVDGGKLAQLYIPTVLV